MPRIALLRMLEADCLREAKLKGHPLLETPLDDVYRLLDRLAAVLIELVQA